MHTHTNVGRQAFLKNSQIVFREHGKACKNTKIRSLEFSLKQYFLLIHSEENKNRITIILTRDSHINSIIVISYCTYLVYAVLSSST